MSDPYAVQKREYVQRLKADPEKWEAFLAMKRASQKRYASKYPERKRESERAYRERNRDKCTLQRRAHRRVQRAARKGMLVRPDRCQECGAKGCIESHHEDYSKPLDVQWLCPRCHRRANLRRISR